MKRLLFLLFPTLLLAGLNDDHDFQVWNTDSINMRTSKKTTFHGQTEFRYGRDGSKLYYKHYQGGLIYIYSQHTVMEFAYRHVFLRREGKWGKIYNPLYDLTFQTQSRRGFYLGMRNRFQYLIFNSHLGGKHKWLYRNRVEIIPALRFSRRGIAPFIADEFFWLESRGISENRLEGGFKIPYHQRTQLNLSYVYRTLKDHQKKWLQQNVLWLHFSLHF